MSAKLAEWYDRAIAFLPNLFLIVLILVATRVVSRRAQGLVNRLAGRTEAPPEIVDLLGRLARLGIVALGILLVLEQLNWSGPALSFIAGLGIVGIVIGFALQDIVKQFAAGVLLLMLRPFRVGDDVKIGVYEGQVVEVQLRATVLKTKNGDEVLIPNADVYTTAIVNISRYNLHRHDIAVSVPPETNVVRVGAALTQTIGDIAGIAASPAPTVVATGLDGQAVKLEVRFWIDEQANNADTVTTAVVAAIRRVLEHPGTEGVDG